MSDTSDYTMVDLGPEKDSISTSSHTVMDQATDEIEDVLKAIRDSLTAMYEANKARALRLANKQVLIQGTTKRC
jgi:hypothetical protein